MPLLFWRRRDHRGRPPGDGLQFCAFISYRSTDRRQARCLQRKLEMYRMPRRLVGKAGDYGPIPARVTPIFRDRDDARTGEEIQSTIAAPPRQSA